MEAEIPQGFYDIILANINRNVLLQYLPGLKNVLRKNGQLLMSGILTTDAEDLIKACSGYNLKLHQQKQRENWITLLFQAQG